MGAVFGIAPEEVSAVRMRFPSGKSLQAKTLQSSVSKARYFLVAVPRGADDVEAEGVDAKGRVVAKTPEGTRLSFD